VKLVVDLLRDHPSGVVEIAGSAQLARRLRAELGPRVAEDETACPIAVIDATGSPHLIRDALRRIADHGVLVLTAALAPSTWELDYYQDLHLRNLTIVGFGDAVA
jgi:threonine dehydrogenase-like Zn-dependent dehydrogenase